MTETTQKPVIYVLCDTTLRAADRALISRAAGELQKLFPMCRLSDLCAGADTQGRRERADRLFDGTANELGRYDASVVLHRMRRQLAEYPNAASVALFTARDLFASSTKNTWCFGLAGISSRVTVQSICRYGQLTAEEKLLCVRRTLRHELGHTFGMAADPNRPHTEDHFGRHCTVPGCSMRQTGTLRELLQLAREEEQSGSYFCPGCLADLRRRFPPHGRGAAAGSEQEESTVDEHVAPQESALAFRRQVADLHSQRKYADALAVAREGLAYAGRNLPRDHESTLKLLEWIGFCCRKLGDNAGAEQGDRALLERLKEQPGKRPELTIQTYEHLARELYNQGKYASALEISREGAAIAEAHLSRDSSTAFTLLAWPGFCCRKLGRYQEAHDADRRCWELQRKMLGEDDERTLKQKEILNFDVKKLAETAPSQSKADPAENALQCRQSNQSGFFIETPSMTLIFDWYKGILPPIRRDRPLHIFISHIHADHFNPQILSLAEKYDNVSIYLGYDYTDDAVNDYLDNLPERTAEALSCFDGNRLLKTDFGSVTSLPSTDLGVAFLVKADGLTLFHAGDLFPWQGCEAEFAADTAPLKGKHIDYAMLPLDPRFPAAAERCIAHYLGLADISCFTPMHLWDKPEFVSAFVRQHPRYGQKMIAQNPGNAAIRESIQLLKPYTIRF
jgi:predicted Zn-dependent protease/L-ascorbate metabolism protein UlaG (beta-lactamase superfamily)